MLRFVGRWEEVPLRRCPNGMEWQVPPRPRIAAIITVAAHGIKGIVDFLIDTGADQTVLMPDDLTTLGITSKHLVEGCPSLTRGIGGARIPIKYLGDVTLEFQGPGGEASVPITMERMAVLFPSRNERRNKSGPRYRGMPSLLGRSFLDLCHFDVSRDGVLIHYEPPSESTTA